jgi:HEAT repeat protein
VAALGRFDDKRAVDALIRSLADPYDEVRQLAASGLGGSGDSRVLEQLEKLAESDPNSEVRTSAVRAIEQITTRLQNRSADRLRDQSNQ